MAPVVTPTAAVVVMGVSGVGKSTVGRALAAATGREFLDADDYHPPANIAKMRAGRGLDDADRDDWLAALHALLRDRAQARRRVVLACSALTRRYRRLLDRDLQVVWVYLDIDLATARQRLVARRGHFAGPELAASQFATLEVPGEALAVDARQPVANIVAEILDRLADADDDQREVTTRP